MRYSGIHVYSIHVQWQDLLVVVLVQTCLNNNNIQIVINSKKNFQ